MLLPQQTVTLSSSQKPSVKYIPGLSYRDGVSGQWFGVVGRLIGTTTPCPLIERLRSGAKLALRTSARSPSAVSSLVSKSASPISYACTASRRRGAPFARSSLGESARRAFSALAEPPRGKPQPQEVPGRPARAVRRGSHDAAPARARRSGRRGLRAPLRAVQGVPADLRDAAPFRRDRKVGWRSG